MKEAGTDNKPTHPHKRGSRTRRNKRRQRKIKATNKMTGNNNQIKRKIPKQKQRHITILRKIRKTDEIYKTPRIAKI